MRNCERNNLGLKGLTGAILAVLLMLTPGLVQAAVVASGQITVNIPGVDGLQINLVTGEATTIGGSVPGWDAQVGPGMVMNANTQADFDAGLATRVSGVGGINNLPLGFTMDGSVPLTPSSSPTTGGAHNNWDVPGDSNYVGIRFFNEATGQYHFGWIRFCLSGGFDDQPRALVEYGYESVAETAIDIGAGGSGLPSDCGAVADCLEADACALADDLFSSTSDCLVLNATASCDTLIFREGDITWTDPGYNIWENVTWQGPAGQQVNASLGWLLPFLDHPVDLTIRTLTLRDVYLSPHRFWFKFHGDTLGVSLEGNATWDVDAPSPLFYSASPLIFQATGGSNVVQALHGNLASPTTLSVGSGDSLQFFYCGSTGPGRPDSSRLNFNQAANHVDIDGGFWELRYSHVIFNTQSGEMLVRNGGHVELFGNGTALETDHIRVNDASVTVGNGGLLDFSDLRLENATIDIDTDAQLTSGLIHVWGPGNTIRLGNQDDPQKWAATIPGIGMRDDAVLTLTGGGLGAGVFAEVLSFIGQNTIVRIIDGADLAITGDTGTWRLGGSIEIGTTGQLLIQDDANVGSIIPIQNDGFVRVRGIFGPRGNMTGSGVLQVLPLGILGTFTSPADAVFTVDPQVVMEVESRFQWLFSPVHGQSQTLHANSTVRLGSSVVEEDGVYFEPIFQPDEDLVLPVGTKYVIIDYPAEGDLTGKFMRSDGTPLNEGDEITIGLNRYRISYLDPEYDPANPSVVTLTVAGDPVATFLAMMDVEADGEGNTLAWSVNGPAEPELFSVFREEDRSGHFVGLESAIIGRTGDEFRFVDGNARPGSTYRYRVKTNIDGLSTVLFTTDFVSVPGFKFALEQNHPNPFNPSTTISFTLAEESTVSLRIYDVAGRLVRDLIPNEGLPAGKKEIVWNGTDAQGKLVSTGVYFYVLDTGSNKATRRMTLVK